MRRITKQTLVVLFVGIGIALTARAGCLGIGSSGNAGFPRDRATISHEVKQLANAGGGSPGALISGLARNHAGSIDACFG